jgi:hypothetical protein
MDDGDVVVRLGGKAQVVRADDLTAEFGFFAQDSGSTPMSDSVKKQELQTLVPLLQQLGVKNETILKALVRSYDLPEDFLPKDEPPAEGGTVAQPPAMGAADQAMASMMQGPSPQNIANVLPAGGVV